MRTLMRVLAAAVVAAVIAPAARAELSLTITGTQGSTSSSQVTSYALPPGTGSGSFTFGGFTVTYTVSAPFDGATQSVVLNATVAGVAGVATDFTYQLTGLPFTQPGPTGAGGFLQSSITTAGGAALTPGTGLNATATYIRLNNGQTTSLSDATVNGGTTQTAVTLGNPYVLQTSGNFSVAANTTVNTTFTSTAAVALPEPASMAALLMGVPCMGGLLAVARRKRPAAPAVVA